mmetsp:Transcript_39098/g.37405  ORF Transcript_39098/g.37405 Transcript_39098/m.37405 type:complete len:105 (+) Transcript_39098:2093-2407(+)
MEFVYAANKIVEVCENVTNCTNYTDCLFDANASSDVGNASIGIGCEVKENCTNVTVCKNVTQNITDPAAIWGYQFDFLGNWTDVMAPVIPDLFITEENLTVPTI